MFIDNLGLELFGLALVGTILLYTTITGYLSLRAAGGGKEPYHAMRSAAVPIGALGLVATGFGVWGELAWPLPGAYNILLTDPFLLLGVVLVAFSVSALLRLKLQYAGLFALAAGLTVIFYGISGYNLNMTKEPLDMLLLFTAFGAAGVMAFPATLVFDRMAAAAETGSSSAAPVGIPRLFRSVGFVNPLASRMQLFVIVLFALTLAGAIVAALSMSLNTLPSHLAHPP